jgi:hypothetical protein
MGKKAPAPPPAPDYAAAAKAQGEANQAAGQQTASLNNPNIYNPYGSQTVSYSPTGPNGAMQASIYQTLNPDAQAALDAQQRVQLQQAQLAQQGMNQASSILGTPFQFQGPDIQTSLGNLGTPQTTLGDYGKANGQLDLSNVAKMPINAGITAQDAILKRLNPTIQQNDQSFAQQLANQGVTAGGEAYDNAMRGHLAGNNDLYSQAALYGLGLDMQANNQGFQQALAQGQFGNQAQQQNYEQALGAGGFYNQGLAQDYNQRLGSAQFGNTAVQQALQHQLGLYNLPLNQINALMSGSQIQAPQFQQYSGGGQIEAAPLANATSQAGKWAMDAYGQQMAGYNSQMQALGSIAKGAMGMFSPMSLITPGTSLFGSK